MSMLADFSAKFAAPLTAAGWHAICCLIGIDKPSSGERRR
jgi:hypothetical protein